MINLSVIIPTRNRATTLSVALESVARQTLDKSLFEVIVCDNNSTDDTEKVARSFAGKFQNFKYLKTLEPGLHVGRNKGFQEAQGEILVYVDDDIEAFPEWLSTIYKVFADKNVALVGGKNLPKWENPPDWALKMWNHRDDEDKILGYFSILDLGNKIKETSPYYVFGCNFSVRKRIIKEARGFHPDGMPQEMTAYRGDGESSVSAYIEQKGYKTIYHPKASVYHLVPKERLTFDYLKKRGFGHGVSDSYVEIRNKKVLSAQKTTSIKYLFKKILYHLVNFYKKPRVEIHQKIYEEGYKEGYNFHQQKVKKNKELMAWVTKNNYL